MKSVNIKKRKIIWKLEIKIKINYNLKIIKIKPCTLNEKLKDGPIKQERRMEDNNEKSYVLGF